MHKEGAIRKLMQAAQNDPDLLTKLVEKPQDVTKEYGISLEPEELQQLQRVKQLQDLVTEFNQGRVIGHPVGYPIDVLWKTTLTNHIISYRYSYYPIFYRPIFYPVYYPIFYPVGYPVGYVFTTGRTQFSGLRARGFKKR